MTTSRLRQTGPNEYLPTDAPRNCPNVVQHNRIDRERAPRHGYIQAIGWAILAVLMLAGTIWLTSMLLQHPEAFK